jgi:hypothetical protein
MLDPYTYMQINALTCLTMVVLYQRLLDVGDENLPKKIDFESQNGKTKA